LALAASGVEPLLASAVPFWPYAIADAATSRHAKLKPVALVLRELRFVLLSQLVMCSFLFLILIPYSKGAQENLFCASKCTGHDIA
jgi:hypothetical protein